MKKLLFILVFASAIFGGLAISHYCYRFPTEAEMSDYHTSHFSSKLSQLESKEYTKVDGAECIVFKGLHRSNGVEEVYFVEAGKRWVMPWSDYNWKSK